MSWPVPALNHVEMVYRPGERQLALGVLQLLGCATVDRGGVWGQGLVDPKALEQPFDSNNVLYVSEVTLEQWRVDQELAACLQAPGVLGDAWRQHVTRLRREPQRSSHFGIRCEDRVSFDRRLDAIRTAAVTPELKGRVDVAGVFFPGDPGAVSTDLAQAFVWTDVFAAGMVSLGQHIELQLTVG